MQKYYYYKLFINHSPKKNAATIYNVIFKVMEPNAAVHLKQKCFATMDFVNVLCGLFLHQHLSKFITS